jgi:hypothetical protein
MSSFAIYIIGFIVLIVGLVLAANLVGISSTYIAIGVVILLGLGILMGVSRTRRPDPPAT